MYSGSSHGSSKHGFHIKLLAGNNVVMVESAGYDTEIFMPQIANGRIVFQNIIPDRQYNCLPSNKQKRHHHSRGQQTSNSKAWRMSAGQDAAKSRLPLFATSTPARLSSALSSNENPPHDGHALHTKSTMATPESARCTVPAPHDVIKDTLVQIPGGIKVIRLYRDTHPDDLRSASRNSSRSHYVGGPSPARKIVSQSVSTNHSKNSSGFHLPDTPQSTQHRTTRKKHKKRSTPLLTDDMIDCVSSPKWRKCITPTRTYSRALPGAVNKRASGNSTKKTPTRSPKIVPSYMVNPTQGTKSSHIVEVRKRKLIIDPKTVISPKSFKQQQNDNADIQRDKSDMQVPSSRKNYDAAKFTAFNMLTNPNRSMSSKLNQQYRKACVNKSSATHPKYKSLSSVPPLEHDQQAAEFTRAKQELRKMAAIEKRQRMLLSNVQSAMVEQSRAANAIRKKVTINDKISHSDSISPMLIKKPM